MDARVASEFRQSVRQDRRNEPSAPRVGRQALAGLVRYLMLVGYIVNLPSLASGQVQIVTDVVKKIREGVVWGDVGYAFQNGRELPTFRGGFGVVYGPIAFGGDGDKSKHLAPKDSVVYAIVDSSGRSAYAAKAFSNFEDTTTRSEQIVNLSVTVGYEFSSTYRSGNRKLGGSLPVSGVTVGGYVRICGTSESFVRIHAGVVSGIFSMANVMLYSDTIAVKMTTETTFSPEVHLSFSFLKGKEVPHILVDISYQYLAFRSLQYASGAEDVRLTSSLLRSLPRDLDLSRFHVRLGVSFPMKGVLE